MFLGPNDGNREVQQHPVNAVAVEFPPTIFYCEEESAGEAGHDEVYFTWGFGDDADNETSHRTAEFGSVSSGTTRDFPHPPDLHKGMGIKKCMAGTMICWEADHCSSEWRDKLGRAMAELAQLARDLSHDVGNEGLNELIGLIPGFGEYADVMFWIENIATLIRALLDWLRNKDDKVKELNYGFSIDWLPDEIGREGGTYFEFDGGGGGHHHVFVEPRVYDDSGSGISMAKAQ